MNIDKDTEKDKSKQKKKRIIFGLGFKSSVLVLLCVALSFGAAFLASVAAHTFIALSANVYGDRMLGRTLAITIDQDIATHIYVEGARIFYGMSEEEKSDPTSSAYLSRFTNLKDEDYLTLQAELRRLAETNDLKWIDMRLFDAEGDRFIYLVDSEARSDQKYSAGYWQYVDEAETTFMAEDTNIEAEESNFNNDNEDDDVVDKTVMMTLTGRMFDQKIFCTLAPFYDLYSGELIGYIGIGEAATLITSEVWAFMVFYFFLAAVFALIVLLISRRFFRSLIIKPIRNLTKAARDYADIDDKLHSDPVFANVKIRSHDELRVLADSMADMELDLASYMEDLTSLTAQQERISAELNVAESIQSSMLPESLVGYEGVHDFEITSYMKPAKEVGGDFYDYFVIDDDHIGLSIADVSGKGVPAALFMAISKTLLKNATMEDDSPARIVEHVNRQLCENNPEMMFVTVWFGIYTVSTHTLVYVNAGHEYPAWYHADSGSYELITEEHDPVLGFQPDFSFAEHTITLGAGDKFFLYTDGIAEATSINDELYGTERMIESLDRARGYAGRDLFAALITDIDNFVSGAEQFDDMTMLLFERVTG